MGTVVHARTWRIAVATAIAASLAAGGLLVRLAGERPAPPRTPEERIDIRVSPAAGWKSLPVVARLDPTSVTGRTSDLVLGATSHGRARLGDLFVSWESDVCTWGGSACAGSPPNLHSLRVGDLDTNGAPMLSTDVRCEGTPPWFPSGPEKRSCSPESLALRMQNEVFIVTFRDPDAEEQVVAVFERGRVRPSLSTSRGRRELAFASLPYVVFAVGLVLLWRAWRLLHVRRSVAPDLGPYRESAAPPGPPSPGLARGQALAIFATVAFVLAMITSIVLMVFER